MSMLPPGMFTLLRLTRTDQAGKRHVIGRHPVQVEFHVDFPFQTAGNPGFQNTAQGFDLIFKILCKGFKPLEAKRAGQKPPG